MAFTLVYSGEHYVFDILLGWLYTVTTLAVAMALMRWWTSRRTRAQPGLAPEPAYAEASRR
jgi:membrane-associated phospholipid phosphatase